MPTISGPLAHANLLLITLDSLRLDIAQQADLPNFSRLHGPIAAYTHGNFTLPAHAAFFTGHLPWPLDLPTGMVDGYQRLIRSAAARKVASAVPITFSGPNLMRAYADNGARVVGVGGVTFFDPTTTGPSLCADFPEFHYDGFRRDSDFGKGRSLVDAERFCGLNTALVEVFERGLDRDRQHFVFINEQATHFPFACPGVPVDAAELAPLALYDESVVKKLPVRQPIIDEVRPVVARRQRAVLEWLDAKMGEVLGWLARLRRPTLVVVCADHGEAFGEDARLGHFINVDTVLTVPMWVGLIDGT